MLFAEENLVFIRPLVKRGKC